tara:strand:- start:1287 stop:1832 length:546 start_codon:yes stop_codon:yes gene_type:complete
MISRKLVLPVLVAGLLGAAYSVSADDGSVLTEDRVNAFYQGSVDAQMKGVKPTYEFIKKHTHDEADITIHSISNMDGSLPQKQTMSLNKQELLRETQKGMELIQMGKVENNILRLEISEDGKSAKVKDNTYSVFTLSMDLVTKFRVEQSMLCDSVIVLNNDNIVQTKSSVCNSEDHVKQTH